MEKQRPVITFRAGSVSCAVWENDIVIGTSTRTVLKATIERRYKDKNGSWKSSGTLSRNEIPLAIHGLQRAFAHIIDADNADDRNGGADAGE